MRDTIAKLEAQLLALGIDTGGAPLTAEQEQQQAEQIEKIQSQLIAAQKYKKKVVKKTMSAEEMAR